MTERLPQEGMTKDQVRRILHFPGMKINLQAYLRAIYETWARPNEVRMADIEDYNRSEGILTLRHTKGKWNPRTRQTMPRVAKKLAVSPTTQALLAKLIGNRKKGPIWINNKGTRISDKYMAEQLQEIVKALGLLKEIGEVPDKRIGRGRKYHGITPKSFREAGERHHDLGGGDSELSAKAAQHTRAVKEKHYKNVQDEEIRQSQREHHPGFTGEI